MRNVKLNQLALILVKLVYAFSIYSLDIKYYNAIRILDENRSFMCHFEDSNDTFAANLSLYVIPTEKAIELTWNNPNLKSKSYFYIIKWKFYNEDKTLGHINFHQNLTSNQQSVRLRDDIIFGETYEFTLKIVISSNCIMEKKFVSKLPKLTDFLSSSLSTYVTPKSFYSFTSSSSDLICDSNCYLTTITFLTIILLFIFLIFIIPLKQETRTLPRFKRRKTQEQEQEKIKALVEEEVKKRISSFKIITPRIERERRAISSVKEKKDKEKEKDKELNPERRKTSAFEDARYESLSDIEIKEHEYLEFIRNLLEGLIIIKHNQSSDKSGKRILFITENLGTIYWKKTNLLSEKGKTFIKKGKSQMEISSISHVLVGKESLIHKRGNKNIIKKNGNEQEELQEQQEQLYLSVVAKDITLDIQAKDINQHQILVHGFQTLINEQKIQKEEEEKLILNREKNKNGKGKNERLKHSYQQGEEIEEQVKETKEQVKEIKEQVKEIKEKESKEQLREQEAKESREQVREQEVKESKEQVREQEAKEQPEKQEAEEHPKEPNNSKV